MPKKLSTRNSNNTSINVNNSSDISTSNSMNSANNSNSKDAAGTETRGKKRNNPYYSWW
jgi:hypothetical protein